MCMKERERLSQQGLTFAKTELISSIKTFAERKQTLINKHGAAAIAAGDQQGVSK